MSSGRRLMMSSRLKWVSDGDGVWRAPSDVFDEDGVPLYYEVTEDGDGEFGVFGTDIELVSDEDGFGGPFESLEEAWEWCEDLEGD